jgi:hypothetical protein
VVLNLGVVVEVGRELAVKNPVGFELCTFFLGWGQVEVDWPNQSRAIALLARLPRISRDLE